MYFAKSAGPAPRGPGLGPPVRSRSHLRSGGGREPARAPQGPPSRPEHAIAAGAPTGSSTTANPLGETTW